MTSATDRNGRVTEFDYDGLNRLVEERLKSGGSTIHTVEYTFDAASQLTAVADDDSAYAYTYLGRITEVDNDTTPDVPHVVLTMAYDVGSRRKSLAAEVDGDDD